MIHIFDRVSPVRDASGGLGPVRLLLIEDDVRLAASVLLLLEEGGWQAEACHTGQDGLERLDQHAFDLVLVDLGLPDIGGHEVMRRIAARGHDVPIIVVSGETQIDAAITALRLGAADYVRKPIEPALLLHSVHRTLKERRLEREHISYQQHIQKSEQLHRFLVENSPDIIFTLGEDGRITYINDRVHELLGLARDAVVGQHLYDLVYADDLDRARYSFSDRKLEEVLHLNMELRLASSRDAQGYRYFETELVAMPCQVDADGDPANNCGGCFYGVARDITSRREAEEWAIHHANYDALTGLPNRNLFRDRLGLAITQAQRNQLRFAVLSLNLDRFSAINDMHGHGQADALLQQVAERIQRCLRGGDTLARFAADEFLLLTTPVKSEADVMSVVERIEQELAAPFVVSEQYQQVTASCGIALYPDHGDGPDALVRHANIALYHGRLSGHGRHSFFIEEMRAYTDYKLHIEQELKLALERQELELHFQPQVDTTSRQIRGVEALVRWNHPQRGLLAPGEFIAVAEESGLIIPLSKWVIAEACRLLQRWDSLGSRLPRVSINLSPRCLDLDDFIDCFTGYLHEYHIAAERIEVEITETMFIRDPAAVVQKLNALAACGVKIAIDDFGTQYSSLGYLQKFPIHTLKIDKSFVWDIDREFRQHTIIKAIISIGHGLGLNLIAEGVETDEQMRFLENQGCNEIQGYLVSRPLACQALEDLLRQDSGDALLARA